MIRREKARADLLDREEAALKLNIEKNRKKKMSEKMEYKQLQSFMETEHSKKRSESADCCPCIT